MNTVDNTEDILDSRDIEKRIDYLEGSEDEDDIEERKTLLALKEEAEGYCDWHDGATLIRESYFQEYAKQLAEDLGAIDRNAAWPLNCIDWEEAADELKADYTEVDFDGVTYFVR